LSSGRLGFFWYPKFVRMLWWFLILVFSAGAVLWAGIAIYLRVRSHMKSPDRGSKETDVSRKPSL
jgi:hypothetical protein